MKSIVFDAGPVISFALNNLLWLFEELRSKYGGKFLVPPAIYEELILRPSHSKKFKFEAHLVSRLVKEGVFKVHKDRRIQEIAKEISEHANKSFIARKYPIKIVHDGEMEVVALAKIVGAESIVIDERTTRNLIEKPRRVKQLLEKKLHTKVIIDKKALAKTSSMLQGINVIRSVELASIAYEMKLLDKFLMEGENAKRELLDGILWGMKLNGCAVSDREISYIEEDII